MLDRWARLITQIWYPNVTHMNKTYQDTILRKTVHFFGLHDTKRLQWEAKTPTGDEDCQQHSCSRTITHVSYFRHQLTETCMTYGCNSETLRDSEYPYLQHHSPHSQPPSAASCLLGATSDFAADSKKQDMHWEDCLQTQHVIQAPQFYSHCVCVCVCVCVWMG